MGPPVRTGLRSPKNVRPIGTRPMRSSNVSESSRSVRAASMRSRYVLPLVDFTDSAASRASFGTPSFSRWRSISAHAIDGRLGTAGSARKPLSCSVIATTAQMLSGVTGIFSTAIGV
jgi:hypothetical protein